MILYNELINLLFFASILYMIYILSILGQKIIEFFVLKNEKTYFVLKKIEKILLWVSLSVISYKIF